MSYPLARLVSAPDPSATVRYDFNDTEALAPRAVLADSFTLGSPSLDSAPDAVSPVYGWRSLSFSHEIGGMKVDALAALAVLSRELLRPSSWLLYQVDAFSRPTWWRILPSGPEALSFDRVVVEPASGDPVPTRDDWWQISVSLTAVNFGYGERITHDAVTVEQTIDGDEAVDTWPMIVGLPTIKGDALTALRVDVEQPTGLAEGVVTEFLIGCVSGTADLDAPSFNIGGSDGLTADVGTSATASDAAYVNGNYRTVTVTADDGGSGTSLARRLYGSLSALTLQGRFKVLLRCEADFDADLSPYLFRLGTGEVVPWTSGVVSSTTQGWVDLGEFTYPTALELPSDFTGTMPAVDFTLYVGTAGNVAGEVRVDAVQFIPVSGPEVYQATLLRSTFGLSPDDESHALWDGDDGLVWMTTSAGVPMTGSAPVTMLGGFPVADPASEKNLLVVMATKVDGIAPDTTDYVAGRKASSSVTVSEHPRLLHLDGRP